MNNHKPITKYDLNEQKNAIANQEVFSFTPHLRGQSAYILDECEANNLLAKYSFGKVRIYAKTKLHLFIDIIEKSERNYKPRRNLTAQVHIWKNNNHIFAVGIKEKSGDYIYTYESTFHKVIASQYVGKIPTTKNIHIYNTEDEFKGNMLLRGVNV